MSFLYDMDSKDMDKKVSKMTVFANLVVCTFSGFQIK